MLEHAKHLGRWLEHHAWMTAGVGLSTLAITLGLTAWFLVRLDDDHFARPPAVAASWLVRVARNLGGVALILVGLVMSLPGVPGQGLLTILIGLMLTDIPGKRRVELFFLRRPSVLGAITKLRARYGRSPLVLPPVDPAAPGASPSVDGSRPEPGSAPGEAGAAPPSGEGDGDGDGAAAVSRRDRTR